MRETLRDPSRLEHILDAIQNLQDSTAEIDIQSLSEMDLRYFGIIKLLEIIGEAAYKITNEFKANHTSTNWDEIIKMRHIMVHGYYNIEKEIVASTINNDLTPLKEQIQQYLHDLKTK